jgi:hypothetical protein
MDGLGALKVGSDDVDEKQDDPTRKNDDPWQEPEGFVLCRGHLCSSPAQRTAIQRPKFIARRRATYLNGNSLGFNDLGESPIAKRLDRPQIRLKTTVEQLKVSLDGDTLRTADAPAYRTLLAIS